MQNIHQPFAETLRRKLLQDRSTDDSNVNAMSEWLNKHDTKQPLSRRIAPLSNNAQ